MSPRREINHIVKYRKADTTPDRNKETPFAEGAKNHQEKLRETLYKLHNSSCRNLSLAKVRKEVAAEGVTWASM